MNYSKRYLAKKLFYDLQRAISSLIWPLFQFQDRYFPPNQARILMYHSIDHFPPEKEIPYDNVPPALFQAHMRILKHGGFHVIPLNQLISVMQENASIPPRTVVITFDDGYKNNVLNAFPILQKQKTQATFFLIAGAVGTNQCFQHLLWDAASRDYQKMNPLSRIPMDWDDVSELVSGGHNLGSHGVTHRSLGRLAPEESCAEILNSKRTIETATNATVTAFSYPFGSSVYGDFNEATQRVIEEAGYLAACTTEIGSVKTTDNLYELKRIPVREQDAPFFFRQKLIGAFDWVNRGKSFFQNRFPRIDKVC